MSNNRNLMSYHQSISRWLANDPYYMDEIQRRLNRLEEVASSDQPVDIHGVGLVELPETEEKDNVG